MIFKFGKSLFRKQKSMESIGAKRLYAPREKLPRLLGNLLILALISSVCIIIVTLRDNLINRQIESILQTFYDKSAQYGFDIEDIIVEGREKTSLEEINAQINLHRGDSLLGVDIKALRENLKTLPWIKDAQIKRTYFPNTIQIRLFEKEVIALWQSGNNFYPVDVDGNLIEAEFTPTHEILVIVGRRAPQKIVELLNLTAQTPDIHKRIKAAVLYGGRRWDIILDSIENGITIKLPEENLQQTWDRFNKINNKHGLLKRKLTTLDLRYPNKLNVIVADSDKKAESVKKQ